MKIWRYMDLAKFTSLIASKALYFSCTTQMEDPYEGWRPRSEMRAIQAVMTDMTDEFRTVVKQMRTFRPEIPQSKIDELLARADGVSDAATTFNEARRRFGISCWHINDYESDAMWKVYTAADGHRHRFYSRASQDCLGRQRTYPD